MLYNNNMHNKVSLDILEVVISIPKIDDDNSFIKLIKSMKKH